MATDLESKLPDTKSTDIDNGSTRRGSVLVERQLSAGEWQVYRETKRGLKPRHVQLMAIGGSIGTGLFVGIGGSLSRAGPLSVFLAYLFWGLLFVWPTNLLVGEMMAWLPVRGTIFELGSRYVDPALGFAMGMRHHL
jgi:yeast amino acid transporter